MNDLTRLVMKIAELNSLLRVLARKEHTLEITPSRDGMHLRLVQREGASCSQSARALVSEDGTVQGNILGVVDGSLNGARSDVRKSIDCMRGDLKVLEAALK